MGKAGFIVKADQNQEKNVHSNGRDKSWGLCSLSLLNGWDGEQHRLKGQTQSRQKQRGWSSARSSEQLRKLLQNHSHFVLVCEAERAARTNPNDVMGLTNEEIRK